MDRTRVTTTNRRRVPREKLTSMGERQFNSLVRKLSAVFASVGLLYAASIIGLQSLGALDLPVWQELSLLVVPPLVGSVLAGFLTHHLRQERIRTRRERKRAEKEGFRSVFDEPSEGYGGFDVVLRSAGPDRTPVIEAVRTATGLKLEEARTLVDGAPNTVRKAPSKQEAAKLKSRLEKAGAEVELR